MRAVRFDRYGDTSVLKIREVARPTPGPDQVLVQVRAAGINPGEVKIRTGALAERWPANFPEGQGSDFAGVIVEVGNRVEGFAVGGEVLGFTNNRASHADYVAAETAQIVVKPAALDWAVAGALAVAGTSAQALNTAANVRVDDVVVVSAASGGVGSLAAQWARQRGATVIGLASQANHHWLRSVDVIPIDYTATDLRARVLAATGGRPVDALLDTYGPPYVDLGFALAVAPERIATIADFAAAERGVTVVQHFTYATPEILNKLASALADHRIQLPIARTYPLTEVAAAFSDLERGHTHGKIVLLP